MGCSFRIEIRREEGRPVLSVEGDLDLASAEIVERLLRESQDSPGLVVDVRGVGCADSSGIRVLLEGARRMEDQGFELRIVGAGPRVARAFNVLGLDKYLESDSAGTSHRGFPRPPARQTRSSGRPLPDA